MAALLADEVRQIEGVTVNQDVRVNAVFASLPAKAIAPLQAWSPFWTWDEATSEVRWMTSWDTTEEDVMRFAAGIRAAVAPV
jgi:threonine aldolase